MDGNEKLYYEVPRGYEITVLRKEAERSLRESQKEIAGILSKHGASSEQAAAISQELIDSPPAIDYDGSGSAAEVVAISVSLVPLVKALTPLLQPFANRGSDLFYKVGRDIWTAINQKMLSHNVRLTEKKRKSK